MWRVYRFASSFVVGYRAACFSSYSGTDEGLVYTDDSVSYTEEIIVHVLLVRIHAAICSGELWVRAGYQSNKNAGLEFEPAFLCALRLTVVFRWGLYSPRFLINGCVKCYMHVMQLTTPVTRHPFPTLCELETWR